MNLKKCIITGTTGLVGRQCADTFKKNGYHVAELNRPFFDLKNNINPVMLSGYDTLIHCAYDFSSYDWKHIVNTNVAGSINLLKSAKEANIQNIIFISSISAFSTTQSNYGKGKILVEEYVQSIGGTIIRPGLVYDDSTFTKNGKGLFHKLYNLTRFPILPVIGDGKQKHWIIHNEDLANIILAACEELPKNQTYTAVFNEPVAFSDLLKKIAKKRKSSILLIPVPIFPIRLLLKFFDLTKIKIGFSYDNLIGLIHPMSECNFDYQDLLSFQVRPLSV